MAYREQLSVGALTEVGIHTSLGNGYYVDVLERDASGNILRASGTTTIAHITTVAGFAKSALYTLTNAGTGVHGLYENTGTTAASVWDLVGAVAAGEITLAEGSLLRGNSSGVAAAVSAKSDGYILIGDGTTVNSVAVAGDVTVTKTGTTTIGGYKVVTGMINTGAVTANGLGALAVGTTALGTGAVTGVKLATGMGYFAVVAATTGSTPVGVFGTTGAPCALTIKGMHVTATVTNAGDISITNGTSTATIAKSATAGAVTGLTGVASIAVVASGTCNIVSSTTNGDAVVKVFFTVA